MKRGFLILALGVAGAVAAFCCAYLMGTATPRALMRSAQPELAWLKHEFGLSEAELTRINQLHTGYLPKCKERCLRIDELNDQISSALESATQVTPELENLLSDRAQVRALCQTEMLNHFFEVSRTMPPAQGQRYLAWVLENTCVREQEMNHGPDNLAEKATPARHP